MDIKKVTETEQFKAALVYMNSLEHLTLNEIIMAGSLAGEVVPESEFDDIENFIMDLPKMTPLMAHLRFNHIHKLDKLSLVIFWWHSRLCKRKPLIYTDDQYKKLSTKVKALKSNNWGISWKGMTEEEYRKVQKEERENKMRERGIL